MKVHSALCFVDETEVLQYLMEEFYDNEDLLEGQEPYNHSELRKAYAESMAELRGLVPGMSAWRLRVVQITGGVTLAVVVALAHSKEGITEVSPSTLPWQKVVSFELEKPSSMPLHVAVAHILWEVTAYGFSEQETSAFLEQRDVFVVGSSAAPPELVVALSY